MADFNIDPKKKHKIPTIPLRMGVALIALLLVGSIITSMGKSRKGNDTFSGRVFENSNIEKRKKDQKIIPRVLPVRKDFEEIPGIYDSIFDDYQYPEDVANLSLEAGPYYYILSKLCTHSDSYWRKHSLRLPRDIRFSDLMQEPDKHRGKIITIKGQIRTLFKQDLAPNNPSQLTYNYHGQIMDMDRNLYSFQCLDIRDAQVDDIVIMTGIFMKRWCYRNRGNKWTWTPLLFSRQLNKVPPPTKAAENLLQYLIIGVLVLAGIFAFILHKSNSEADKSFREFMYANRNRKKIDPKKVAIRKRSSYHNLRKKDEDTSEGTGA